MLRNLFFLLLFLQLLSAPSLALQKLDPVVLKAAVENSRRAEGGKLGDYALFDQDGKPFMLGEYFETGKPLVLSFIYTSCPEVCPTITSELKRAVDGAREKLGERFEVLTIGFDAANDTPERLKEYGKRFTGSFEGFRFAGGDAGTIERLLADAGFFHFRQDDGSFDHMDMVTTVKPDGTIYRQVYGIRSQPQNLAMRLDELVTGKAAVPGSLTLVERIKFFCYRYDPQSGKYVLDYPVFAGMALQALVIGAVIYAVWGRRIGRWLKRK